MEYFPEHYKNQGYSPKVALQKYYQNTGFKKRVIAEEAFRRSQVQVKPPLAQGSGGAKPPNVPRGRITGPPSGGMGRGNFPRNYNISSSQLTKATRGFRATRGAQVAAGVAKGFMGVGAIAALGAEYAIKKGYERATGPGGTKFHSGKAGSHYLDVSVNKPGKYGIDY